MEVQCQDNGAGWEGWSLPRQLFFHLLVSLLLVGGYVRFKHQTFAAAAFSDAFAVLGLIYLVVAVFRLVDRLRFFDSAKFGLRKFLEVILTRNYSRAESQVGSFVDYTTRSRKMKPLASVTMIACAWLTMAFLLAA